MKFSIKNFFKYNPITDAAKTFNIEEALNKNWDKVNEMGQDLSDDISVVNTSLMVQNRGKNFLHNWYFKLPPINQRGALSYTTTGFIFDRWGLDLNGGTAEASIQDGFIRLARTSVTATAAQSLYQNIENGYLLSGQTVTLSVKHRNAQLGQMLIFGAGGVVASIELPISADWKITKLTTTLPTITSAQNLAVFIYWGLASQTSITGYTDYQAIKLELGDKSTLANDLFIDITEELSRCRRYLVRYSPTSNFSLPHLFAISATVAYCVIPLPTSMRNIAPTLNCSAIADLLYGTGGLTTSITGLTLVSYDDKMVCFSVTGTFTTGATYRFGIAGGKWFEINREL